RKRPVIDRGPYSRSVRRPCQPGDLRTARRGGRKAVWPRLGLGPDARTAPVGQSRIARAMPAYPECHFARADVQFVTSATRPPDATGGSRATRIRAPSRVTEMALIGSSLNCTLGGPNSRPE